MVVLDEGKLRRRILGCFHELARQKESKIVDGHLRPDHLLMCISIPPKYAVASVIGFLKGKSSVAIVRSLRRPLPSSHLPLRGYTDDFKIVKVVLISGVTIKRKPNNTY